MLENEKGDAPRRCRGRPQVRSDEETRGLILEAAGHEFQANGYEATCIANVAERAGVSTKTLYRLVPTKADLFTRVVADRIGRFVIEYDLSRLDSLSAPAALERMLTVFGTLTLEPRTIALTRLVLGESAAFPEVGAAFYENAIMQTSQAMEAGLQRLCSRGLIALDDPHEAVGMLRGMMIMEPQRAAMLGRAEPPTREEIAARAKRCAKLFLDGCAIPPPPKRD
jgi:AcrR family transcriptional regulator